MLIAMKIGMIEKLISYLKRHKNMASLNQISIL